MADIISNGETNGIRSESMTLLNGGIQVVPDPTASPLQIIYLDFDGELTRYRNADLNLEIDDVRIEDPGLSSGRIAGIIAALNAEFSGRNVFFTSERPGNDMAYSTIFVGRTSAFDRYGSFAGLAETVDHGNQIKDDNAFVLLDAASADSDIVSTIAHEAGHLLGTLDHGGDDLVRYADDEHEKNPGYIYYYKTNNHNLTGNLDSQVTLEHLESSRTIVSSIYRDDGGDAYVSVGKNYDEAHDVTILDGGHLEFSQVQGVSDIDVQNGGRLDNNGCIISGVTVRDGGYFCGSASGVYVEKGATLDGSYFTNGKYYQATLAQDANVGSFVNLSDKEQTLSLISRDREADGNVSAYLYDQTLTNLKCTGVLYINGGGVVSGGEIASGGVWDVNQGSVHGVSIASDASMHLTDGTLTGIDVLGGGRLTNNSGVVSGVKVRNGGYLQCNAQDVYVEEGAVLNGDYWTMGGHYYQVTLAPNAGIESLFVNLSDKDQTFSYVYRDRGTASATLSGNEDGTDHVLTGLKCQGTLNINSGVVVDGGGVVSGYWQVNSGGDVQNISVSAGGTVHLNNGNASYIDVLSGGNLTGTQDGLLSGVTVRNGGYIRCTAQDVYVEEGATVDGNYWDCRGDYYQITLAQNACVGAFANLGDEQTFTYIHRDRGDVYAYLSNQVVSGLKCTGHLSISGGIVSGGEVASGGQWTVVQDGSLQNVTIASGGHLNLSDGTGSKFEVQTGGKLSVAGNVSEVYVQSGAFLTNGTFFEATMAVNANCGNEYASFTNLSDKEQTFSKIYIDQYGNARAFVSNQTITDLRTKGSTNIVSGGIVSAGEVVSGGSWFVSQGGYVENIRVFSSGSLCLEENGSGNNLEVLDGGVVCGTVAISGLTVRSGGAARCFGTACDVYIESGASIMGAGYQGEGIYYQVTLGAEVSAGNFCNLSDREYAFSYIKMLGERYATAFITDRKMEDLKCTGSLCIMENGIVSDGEIVSGGSWFVSQGGYVEDVKIASGGSLRIDGDGIADSIEVQDGGRATVNGGGLLEQVFQVEGYLEIGKGGVARIWSASTVTGESASLRNEGTVEFLVASAAAGGEVLLDDYTKVSDGWGGGYAITVNGSQQSGQYRLIGNAAAFKKEITIKAEDSEETGKFQWNGSGYNSVKIGDTYYTLKKEGETGDLILTKHKPISISITPEELGQLYFAEKDDDICFAMDYLFSVDITYFDELPDGTYSYTANLENSDGTVDFNFTVTNGVFSYNSNEQCYSGEVIQNSDGSKTWHLEHAVDTFYINQLDSDSVKVVLCGVGNASTEALSSTGTIKATACTGSYADANKHYGIEDVAPISFTYKGVKYHLDIDAVPIFDLNDPDYPFYYKALFWKEDEQTQTSLSPESLKVRLTQVSEMKTATIRISGSSLGNLILNYDRGKCSLVLESTSEKLDAVPSQKYWLSWNYGYPEYNACWIATGVNMLYRAGYFSKGQSYQKIYECLVGKYYSKYVMQGRINDKKIPELGFIQYILGTFLEYQYNTFWNTHYDPYTDTDKKKSKRWVAFYISSTDPNKPSRFETWKRVLHADNDWCVSALHLPGHVITVYDVTDNDDGTYTAICADSDNYLDSPKTEERILRLKDDGMTYEIQTKSGYKDVSDAVIMTISGSSKKNPFSLSIDDLKAVIDSTNAGVYGEAVGFSDVEGYGLALSSNGRADEIIVKTDGSLLVESGATVGSLYVQPGGSATLNEGANIDILLEVTGRIDVAGPINVSEVQFTLFETGPNTEAMINNLVNCGNASLNVMVYKQEPGVYLLADGASDFVGAISLQTFGSDLGTLKVGETLSDSGIGYTLNLDDSLLSLAIEELDLTPTGLLNTADGVAWDATGAEQYIVEYSTDNFEHVIQVVTTGNEIGMPDLPAGTYQWRVKADGGEEWSVGEEIVSEADGDDTPKVVQAVEDGRDDLFFASSNGKWSLGYYAQNVGSINDWGGTGEVVSAKGKGRIQNLFFGSYDPNVLCLTDADNGDAIFVDDAFTGMPEEVEENTARLYRIQEIRAGAGDDIVDMTSQRCEYTGGGLTIRGGDGDDVIWTNKGDNLLFGDAGNDRIVGASGDDFIIGGTGDDSMHGGGGDDVFTFCDNWGADTVEQLEDGFVTLWFASGDESNWNAETLTYTDGTNSVTVSGVSVEQITLLFGDYDNLDHEMFDTLSELGAFDGFTSRKVFEESGEGLLASL